MLHDAAQSSQCVFANGALYVNVLFPQNGFASMVCNPAMQVPYNISNVPYSVIPPPLPQMVDQSVQAGYFIDPTPLNDVLETVQVMEDGPAQEQMTSTLQVHDCLLYTSPSPRDRQKSRMPSSA